MATGSDVMAMLCKGVAYTVYGDDYNSIIWYDKAPAITKTQFEAGFADYDAWKAEQVAAAVAAKEAAIAKLAALGLDLDDLKSLGF